MEVEGGLFEAIEALPHIFSAIPGSFEASFDGEVEPEGEVGGETAGGDLVELLNEIEIQLATVALVGNGGIGVAIAEDDFAAIEGRLNRLADVLGAIGGVEEELGGGGKAIAFEQKLAEDVAEGSAARLAGGQGGMAEGFEFAGEVG